MITGEAMRILQELDAAVAAVVAEWAAEPENVRVWSVEARDLRFVACPQLERLRKVHVAWNALEYIEG